MKPFSLLVKPVSADCNLGCEYCFYLEKAGLYPESKVHRMPEDVLEKMISSFMATDQRQYSFGWQGGEPTLAGTSFFRKAVEFQKRYGRPGAVVANGLQTNGTLLDDEMAELFAEFKFLAGVSLDGPPELHDVYRRNRAGQGSHKDVLAGIEILRRHQVEFNILVLVSKANVSRPKEVFDHLRGLGASYHQYIPCVEFDGAGRPMPYSISGDEWGAFLCGIFDRWRDTGIRKTSVRLFDSILVLLVDRQRNVCNLGTDCRQYFLVEHNGDVYPCDFFVRKDLRLGNVMENSWGEMETSETYARFGRHKKETDAQCPACEFLEFCMGDCPKHRPGAYLGNRGKFPRRSVLCEGWKTFFRHSLPKLKVVAEKIWAERAATGDDSSRDRIPSGHHPVERNSPCPCGSGKKYKRCCMRTASAG